MIRWEFPARGELPPVALHWYDGGLRPPLPAELEADGEEMPEEGLLLVGDRGKILGRLFRRPSALDSQGPACGISGRRRPACRARSASWTSSSAPVAARGPSAACFEKAYPFAETILLGTIALRVEKKLRWDAAKMEFTNSAEANQLRFRKNRTGWEVS